MRAPWLGDVLRNAGLPVRKFGDPIGRGKEMREIVGVVDHDTVTTTGWSDYRVCELLRDGRPGVPGPLSQLGLDRSGTFWWIADGRSNHNGYGRWGNHCIGIEVFCAGGLNPRSPEPYNRVQAEHVARANAAILRHIRKDEGFAQGHKEQDPRRKVDPYGVDMGYIRSRTRAYLADVGAPSVPTTPPKSEDWFDMASKDDLRSALREEHFEIVAFAGSDRQGLVDWFGKTVVWIDDVKTRDQIAAKLGIPKEPSRTFSTGELAKHYGVTYRGDEARL